MLSKPAGTQNANLWLEAKLVLNIKNNQESLSLKVLDDSCVLKCVFICFKIIKFLRSD